MPSKQVSFPIQSVTDIATNIGGQTITDTSITDLVTNQTEFYLNSADGDTEDSLCLAISSTTQSIEGTFQNALGDVYTLNSLNFVGGRPPHRPK